MGMKCDVSADGRKRVALAENGYLAISYTNSPSAYGSLGTWINFIYCSPPKGIPRAIVPEGCTCRAGTPRDVCVAASCFV